MSSSMSLRTRTPQKRPVSRGGDYEELATVPIGGGGKTPQKQTRKVSRGGGGGDFEEVAAATATTPKRGGGVGGRTTKTPLLETPKSKTRGGGRGGARPCSREGDCSDMEGDDDDEEEEDVMVVQQSPEGSGNSDGNSNEENEEVEGLNGRDSTPRKLSRRKETEQRFKDSASLTSTSFIDDEAGTIKLSISKTQGKDSSILTPLNTTTSGRYALRKSVRKNETLFDPSSQEEEGNSTANDDTPKRPTRRTSTYFSKKYSPEDEESTDGEEDDEEDEEASESDEESGPTATPSHSELRTQNLARLVLTPEVLQRVEGHAVKRKLICDSPVASGSQTMSPNPEAYFLADTRIKYRKEVKLQDAVPNDSAKGKRRKKRMIERTDKLPERLPSNFSVTTEALKAAEDMDFIPGSTHDEEVERLFQNVVENEFPQWLGLFRDGFNVMLYGYGSKLDILNEFEKRLNDRYLVVTMNGLFPKLNPRKLLQGLCDHVNPNQRPPHGINIEAVARDAVRTLKAVDHPDIFILLNNFDSMALRLPQMLTVLCLLSEVPFIHILASCDTVNAFLGVTQSQSQQLRFCWLHCPTFRPYKKELHWTPGIYGEEAKAVNQKSSLKYVLQSLTGNARKAFGLLGQMQLKQQKAHAAKKSKDAYTGVRFQELAKVCREKFIAHSDENLRTLLVEFFDHKLISQTAKGRHIENTLLVELDSDTLEEVIQDFV